MYRIKKSFLTLPKVNKPLYIGLFLLIIKTFLSSYQYIPYGDVFDTVLSFSAAAFLVFEILREGYSVRDLAIYLVIVTIALFICYNVKNFSILVITLVCLSIRRTKINKVILFLFKYEMLFFIVLIFWGLVYSFSTGTVNYFIYRGYRRYHLGFVHPNYLSAVVFNLLAMWCWLNYYRLDLKKISVLMFIEVLFFLITRTRTSLVDFAILAALILFYRNKNYSRILSLISKTAVPVLSGFVFVLSKVYYSGNVISRFFNTLLTGRIKYAAYAYLMKGLTFFGQDFTPFRDSVKWDEVYQMSSFTFDCFYSYAMMNLGIIVLVVISFCFFMLASSKNVKINIFIICWALYGLTEIHGINCCNCFPIILMALAFDKNIEQSSNKSDSIKLNLK